MLDGHKMDAQSIIVFISVFSQLGILPSSAQILASNKSNIYGNDVVKRLGPLLVGGDKSWIDTVTPLPTGVLQTYYVYIHNCSYDGDVSNSCVPDQAKATTEIRLQIWRPLNISNHQYALVYESIQFVDFTSTTGLLYAFDVVSDNFNTVVGDLIGWTNLNVYGPVSLTYENDHRTIFKEVDTVPTVSTTTPYTFDRIKFPAIFSVAVQIDPSSSNNDTQMCSVAVEMETCYENMSTSLAELVNQTFGTSVPDIPAFCTGLEIVTNDAKTCLNDSAQNNPNCYDLLQEMTTNIDLLINQFNELCYGCEVMVNECLLTYGEELGNLIVKYVSDPQICIEFAQLYDETVICLEELAQTCNGDESYNITLESFKSSYPQALAELNCADQNSEPDDLCLDCICGVMSGDQTPGCGIAYWFKGDRRCGGSGCIMRRRECRCGPYQLTKPMFFECRQLTELQFYNDFHKCSWSNSCARQCIKAYLGKHTATCIGKPNDELTCEDYAKVLFNFRSYDPCPTHTRYLLYQEKVQTCYDFAMDSF